MTCIFCEKTDNLFENDLAKAFFDKFPASKGHILIVPRRHVPDYFGLTNEEHAAVQELLTKSKCYLDDQFAPDGYNIGANVGQAGGQTVFHCHIHLIPRYAGDCPEPAGGVRGAIPGKQTYQQRGL
ncbi:MAG: HIT family protein [Streptococcaceae bacterium]|jgi:diadenosine tetraphosphate (Ap4A) HIT family hydrolase|nr:HIT family protein [Streptococcaceae bacterium]